MLRSKADMGQKEEWEGRRRRRKTDRRRGEERRREECRGKQI